MLDPIIVFGREFFEDCLVHLVAASIASSDLATEIDNPQKTAR